jgi:hypothetical protein
VVTPDTDQILHDLAAAFPAEPVPPKDALLNTHCCECVEVSEAFGYKRWPDVSLDDLRAGGETALLTPVAWRYYLPAVIAWCIREPETVDVIQDNLVFQLAPPPPDGPSGLHEWFRQRMDGFTELQRRTIVGYLSWYRAHLERQWENLRGEPPQQVYRALKHWAPPDRP